MNRRINIFFDQTLIQQYSVLVIVSFPGHKPDQHVASQSQFTLVGRRTVCNNLPFFNTLSHIDNNMLIDTGCRIRTQELNNAIFIQFAFIIANHYFTGINTFYNTAVASQHAVSGIHTGAVFHTGSDNRSLGFQQRHSLTLHVRAHQCTNRVIILQERNQRRCHRNNHSGRNVNIIYPIHIGFHNRITITHRHALALQTAVFIDRLIRLSNHILIFDVCRHIHDVIGHKMSSLFNPTIRRLNKAIFIDPRITGKIRNQTDVRTFRGFYRAHPPVMGIVNVTHIKACAVSGQTAGTQCRQSPLMRNRRQRVGLVHKLRQRGRSKELTDRRNYRPSIQQTLRRNHVYRLHVHPLFYGALHSGKADPELILQQFAYRPNPSITQMVDIINRTNPVAQS